ncbi:conserved hypothetical phage protein [Salmonella phage Vi06]|uniref:Conserved hypothetical phage protein n=1 Tax=Salmonella phage Vi06 TaxID=866889 RepID=E1XU87_9CAUD|nr:hypothetical protein Vi06_08 [Salmonella phage Vi06]CBV65206.1 conserved hypothetical phage protein [Salmonella phage Vi06]
MMYLMPLLIVIIGYLVLHCSDHDDTQVVMLNTTH